jgi:hypothetical protein
MKKTIVILILSISVAAIMPSCMSTKTNVGNYREMDGKEYTYDKGKQLWLFWGLLPIGRTSVDTPSSGDCAVLTKLKLGDFLISGITGGIITSYTITVKAKK